MPGSWRSPGEYTEGTKRPADEEGHYLVDFGTVHVTDDGQLYKDGGDTAQVPSTDTNYVVGQST